MTENRDTIREVSWHELCPWLILLRTFRIALSPRVLLLAAVALVTVTAGQILIGQIFRGTDDPTVQNWIQVDQMWPGRPAGQLPGPPAGPTSIPPKWIPGQLPWSGPSNLISPITDVWQHLSDPFARLFRWDLGLVGLAYLLLFCLWTIAIWGLFAGAITRIAALALARDESLGPKAALIHAGKKWRDYVSAPLLPLLGCVLAAVFLLVLGLFMRLDFFVFVAGFLWPGVLLVGLFLAVLLIGLLAGWPLLWPAISVEKSDAFDAISNSYAYVYQRPLRYLLYAALAALVGLVGALVVHAFVDATDYLSRWAVSWGTGGQRMDDVLASVADRGWLLTIGATLITIWTECLRIVKPAFYHGFFWTAATAVYFLLRRDVDAKEMDEVVLDDNDQPGGLPPLTEAETGVPQAPTAPTAEKPAGDEVGQEEPGGDETAAEQPGGDQPATGDSPDDHSGEDPPAEPDKND